MVKIDWKQVIDNLPVGVGFIGSDNNLVFFNKVMGRDFGWSEDRLGKNAVLCHRPENQEKVKRIMDSFRRGGAEPVRMIYETKMHHRKLLTQYAPVYDESGSYLGATCIIVDITNK